MSAMECMVSCSPRQFEEFWNCGSELTMEDWYESRFDRELAGKLLTSSFCINFLLLSVDVKMACAPEICEYYSLPLPAEAKPEGIRKIMREHFLRGWRHCEWLWNDAVTKFPEDADTQFWDSVQYITGTYERSVGILEEIAAALVPYVMHAHKTKLEQARVRTQYGIVLMQIRFQTSFLRGFKAKNASFQ